MSGGEQHLKKAAALAYDYDSDPRWAEYWSNVLIPPHLSSKPDVLRHFKFKFYQRYIDGELEVEPLSSSSTSRTTVRTSPSSSIPNQQQTSNSGTAIPGEYARDTRGAAQPRRSTPSGSLQLDHRSFQFLENAWVVSMAALAVLLFVWPTVADRSYRFTFLATAISCAHSIFLQYSIPRAINLQSIQTWLHSVVAGKDFLYFLFSLVFISAVVPLKFAVIPVLCRSLEYCARYLRTNFSNTRLYRKYLAKPCIWLESNNATLRILSANSEVGLGFLLLFLLLTPQRNLILFLVYWQLLKLMYHAPATASYHRNTWSRIGMTLNPMVNRYLPILQTPIGFAERWFQN